MCLSADELDNKEKGFVAAVGIKRDEEMPQEPAQTGQGEEGLVRPPLGENAVLLQKGAKQVGRGDRKEPEQKIRSASAEDRKQQGTA